MFAIINTKTGKFVYGTDYRYRPPHQRTSSKQMLTYPSLKSAALDFVRRKCGHEYEIASLYPITIQKIIDRNEWPEWKRDKNESKRAFGDT